MYTCIHTHTPAIKFCSYLYNSPVEVQNYGKFAGETWQTNLRPSWRGRHPRWGWHRNWVWPWIILLKFWRDKRLTLKDYKTHKLRIKIKEKLSTKKNIENGLLAKWRYDNNPTLSFSLGIIFFGISSVQRSVVTSNPCWSLTKCGQKWLFAI